MFLRRTRAGGRVAGMRVLTVNAGSSSIRLALLDAARDPPQPLYARHLALAGTAPRATLEGFLVESGAADAVAHRVVHGGAKLVRPCRINTAVEAEIERLIPLAPLHNPPALAWMRACREALGDKVPQVAVFDTGFYAGLPPVAASYALPRALCRKHGIRRYGFHGLAHEAMWQRWRALRPEILDGGRVISLQLGAGCSITAIRDGRPVDTSMGFSPLEGLVMATRSGDVDPGLLLFLQRVEGLSPERAERLLNEESGLLGLSGMSGDMQRLLGSSEPAARLAVDLYCYRARKFIGAYLAALGGADAILFGGGVGENATPVRAAILAGLSRLGLALDPAANAVAVGTEARISHDDSEVEAWVVPVNEAAILARTAQAALASDDTGGHRDRD